MDVILYACGVVIEKYLGVSDGLINASAFRRIGNRIFFVPRDSARITIFNKRRSSGRGDNIPVEAQDVPNISCLITSRFTTSGEYGPM